MRRRAFAGSAATRSTVRVETQPAGPRPREAQSVKSQCESEKAGASEFFQALKQIPKMIGGQRFPL